MLELIESCLKTTCFDILLFDRQNTLQPIGKWGRIHINIHVDQAVLLPFDFFWWVNVGLINSDPEVFSVLNIDKRVIDPLSHPVVPHRLVVINLCYAHIV